MGDLMTNLQPFLNWLLQSTLIASIVICLILIAQKVLGGKLGPRWSHALWLVLLIRMVFPGAPPSQIQLFNLIPSENTQIQQQQPANSTRKPALSALNQSSDNTVAKTAQSPEYDARIQTKNAQEPGISAVLKNKSKPWMASLFQVLPYIWLSGAVLIGLYLFLSNFFLWRIIKRERLLLDQKTLELFEECKEQMGVHTLVGLIPSAKIKSPALFGFIRPRLLLPLEMIEEASQEEMKYIFLHELAHLKRRDIYLGWLTSLLQIIHWFNPLVWFAFYRMRADRELSCDALVLSRTGKEKSQDYGKALVGLLRRFSQSRPLPAMAGILENKSQLKRRIIMIAQFKKKSYHWSPLAVFSILVLGFASFSFTVWNNGQKTYSPKSEPSISLRRVETGPISDLSGPPSLDGQYLCDLEGRNLVIRDLFSGEDRVLTEWSRGSDSYPIISPESKHVAYINRGKLQLIDMDGTGHRILYQFKEDEEFNIRLWTPDGNHILGVFYKNKEDMQFVTFSVEDGSMRVLHTFETKWNFWRSGMAISPDGCYIAYDRAQKEDSEEKDIFIFDIEHNRTECVVQNSADDKLLGWTPDNNYIFFSSDRRKGFSGTFTFSATCNGYLLPVAEGRRQGPAELIKRDLPSKIRPKGFTRDGSYYYAVEFRTMEAAVAVVDMKTGNLMSKPQAVGQTGNDVTPAWSPDGKYLAYCVNKSNESGVIRIRNMKTGHERELDPDLPPFSSLQWSPDGKYFLVSIFEDVWNQNFPQYIYSVDANTGERVVQVQSDSTILGAAQLSLDGTTLYYVNQYPESGKASIMTKDLESGHKKELLSLADIRNSFFLTFAVSPDERQLAIASLVLDPSRGEAEKRILTLPVNGGVPKELLKIGEKRAQRPSIAWTPDGKSLLFASYGSERGGSVFLIPVSGGQARELCRPQTMTYGSLLPTLDVHPDGQHFAFNTHEYRHEVWAMENFLPSVASKDKGNSNQ